MTKNVQCRNGYVNHWEAQPPYIANYKFSSTEHDIQVVCLMVVIIASIINISLSDSNLNLWIALLTSCLGYLLPSPKIKKIKDVSLNSSQ